MSRGPVTSRLALALLAVMLFAIPARSTAGGKVVESDEELTAALLDSIRTDPPRLRMFLQRMPKGGDLHNHLSGSIYAEDFLAWGAEKGFCIDAASYAITSPPCDGKVRIPIEDIIAGDPFRYGQIVTALSTRGMAAGFGDPKVPAFERFFRSFDALGPVPSATIAQALAQNRRDAASEGVSYRELITLPRAVIDLYPPAMAVPGNGADFDALSNALGPRLPAAVAAARRSFDQIEGEAAALNDCATNSPKPACAVTIRYQAVAVRNVPPAKVFAALSFAFAIAEADPRFVGVNIAAPEHDPIAIRDYTLHMRMLAYLHARHPNIPLSLHAGELTLGLVPPHALRSHIGQAVGIAGARRIGHGVDLPYEDGAGDLLRRMARDRVAVEINLTSNAVILGVKGKDHPLPVYLASQVPVVLSTDDQGVTRSDMTNEYLRAVQELGLTYRQLKQIVRNSLEYAFVSGCSLWVSGPGSAKVAACASPPQAAGAPCASFLADNEKARLQWSLEQKLAEFERER